MRGIYLPAFFPTKEIFEKCVDSIVENGFDFVEIGVPFSEPVADGPVISSAYSRVLNSKTKIEEIFQSIEEISIKYSKRIKIFIMTYSNIIFDYGIENFNSRFKTKLRGLIIADCPNKMQNFFYKSGLNIPIIPFVTPESREEDLQFLQKTKADFVYCIGIRGITGAKMGKEHDYLKKLISDTKKYTEKSVVLGFGIKTKKDTELAFSIADGFVIGTEAVKNQENLDDYKNFLEKL